MATNTNIEKEAIATYIFMDLETTGLRQHQPRITELSMVAVNENDLWSSAPTQQGKPRVMDKLTLCVDPGKELTQRASELSGLTKNMLSHKSTFDAESVQAIQGFINRQASPSCLIAHNGLGFDFPLLRAEFIKIKAGLPPQLMIIDSMELFKDVEDKRIQESSESNDSENSSASNNVNTIASRQLGSRRSAKLEDVYSRVVGGNIDMNHTSEGDSLAIVEIFRKIEQKEIKSWINKNHQLFARVEPMYQIGDDN